MRRLGVAEGRKACPRLLVSIRFIRFSAPLERDNGSLAMHRRPGISYMSRWVSAESYQSRFGIACAFALPVSTFIRVRNEPTCVAESAGGGTEGDGQASVAKHPVKPTKKTLGGGGWSKDRRTFWPGVYVSGSGVTWTGGVFTLANYSDSPGGELRVIL